jgi:hypothetical protein
MLPIDLQLQVQAMCLRGVDSCYKRYHIKQGTKRRQIEEPNSDLKALQQAVLPYLNTFPFLECCTATVGKGALHNADKHQKSKWILKVDLKNCYQSITKQHLEVALNEYPELRKLLDICICTNYYYCTEVLPTGAPTSPTLCNIALTAIDKELIPLAKEYNLVYTRYLDDMIFSTDLWTYPDKGIYSRVVEIIETYEYQINRRKSRWFRKHCDPMIVTGISVNEHKGIPQEMKRSLRSQLFKAAINQLDLNSHILGQLGYVKNVDKYSYDKLMAYYESRKTRYTSPQQTSNKDGLNGLSRKRIMD